MVGAVVWTYWMSFPLLALVVTAVVAFAVAYYHNVALPVFLSRHERQLETGGPKATVLPLRPRRSQSAPDGRRIAA